jgi:hypothetical protein
VSEKPTPEDHALQAALAALEGGAAPPVTRRRGAPPEGAPQAAATIGDAGDAGDAAEAETLARLYHEVLGLLPAALPPAAVPPGVKERLMAAVLGAAAGSPPAGVGPPAAFGAAGSGAPAPFPPRIGPVSPPVSEVSPIAGPRRARRWPVALAAALILALLGTCGWLVLGLRQQGATIAGMARQRDEARQHAGEAESRLARLTAEVESMRDRVAVVASPGVEACALKPVTPEMTAAHAHGMLFVAADHQHGYLSLRGLPPAGGNRVYQLWFVADQGPVSGGTFTAEPGKPWELSAEHMPAGTKAVRVTLENGAGALAPSGPDVLRNADTLHAI